MKTLTHASIWVIWGDLMEIIRMAPSDAVDLMAVWTDIVTFNATKLQADMNKLMADAPEAAAAIQKLLTDLGI